MTTKWKEISKDEFLTAFPRDIKATRQVSELFKGQPNGLAYEETWYHNKTEFLKCHVSVNGTRRHFFVLA